MTLDQAIRIVCDGHTRDDPRIGYTVESMPQVRFGPYSPEDYVKAWGVLRAHVHLPTKPEDYKI